nr:GNAT family N-acetyltransferase [Rothia sp. ZJ932]
MTELTITYARITGTKESSVWVMLNEIPRDNWGVGGQSLTALDEARTQENRIPDADLPAPAEEHEPTLELRQAADTDIDRLAEIEAECFPAAEAASLEILTSRFNVFGNHFWVLEADGEIIGFIDGMVTNSPIIFDELFTNPAAHTRHGAYQTILGLNVIPAMRSHGYAAILLSRLIEQARAEKRTGVILTCKKELIDYYKNFGFKLDGVSDSAHGGARWYDMTLTF